MPQCDAAMQPQSPIFAQIGGLEENFLIATTAYTHRKNNDAQQ